MADLQDEKVRIDEEARIKKEEADKQAAASRQMIADQEAQRVIDMGERARMDAEIKARQIKDQAQN